MTEAFGWNIGKESLQFQVGNRQPLSVHPSCSISFQNPNLWFQSVSYSAMTMVTISIVLLVDLHTETAWMLYTNTLHESVTSTFHGMCELFKQSWNQWLNVSRSTTTRPFLMRSTYKINSQFATQILEDDTLHGMNTTQMIPVDFITSGKWIKVLFLLKVFSMLKQKLPVMVL